MVALSTLRSLVLAVPFLQNSFEVRGESPDGDSISTLKNRLLQFSDTEFQYLSECENTLLGESVIKDGLISQQDFSDAYQSFCSKYSAGADCPKGRFQGLPPRLQFLFYEAVCETMPYPEQCAKRLNTLNTMAFGYIVSDDTMAKVQMNVERLCLEMIEHVFITKAPTIVPIDRFPDTASPPDLTEPPPTDEPVSLPLDQINQDTGNIPREPASTPPADDTETVSEGETTTESTDPEGKFDTDTSESLTHGPIIGIASLSLVCLLLIMFVVHRRRQANQQEKPFAKTTCDNDTSADSDPEAPGSYIESVTRNETSISVFDASGAGEIALKMSSDASSVSQNDFGRGFAIPADRVSMREIEEALDNGNWDEVYKLASHLAEQEDLSTLSSFGRQSTTGRLSNERMERRSVLKEEDHERVKTLDELIDSRDWTGVAVTAALYAGESGYKKQDQSSRSGFFGRVTGQRVSNAAREASSQEVATPVYQNSRSALGARTIEGTSESADDVEAPMENGRNKSSNDLPLFHLKNSMDHAVDAGDWDQVLRISSEVEKNGEFQSRNASPSGSVVATAPSKLCNASSEGESLTAFKTLIEEMDRAMSRGDWALVGFYADKIREMKVSGEDTTPDAMTSQALVPFSGPPAISSARTEDSIMTKKSTLEKLVQAQKWKGVSIMAGLYAMEAKGSLSAELC